MDFASGYKLDVNAHFNVKICQYSRDKTILEISKGDDSLDKSLEFNEIQHNDVIFRYIITTDTQAAGQTCSSNMESMTQVMPNAPITDIEFTCELVGKL